MSTPLIVPAVDAGNGTALIFLSGGLAGKGASTLSLRDGLLATSAAPTFFPVHRIDGRYFVDGGLVANAPELVAITETVRHLGCDLNDIRILSVGTAGPPHSSRHSTKAPGLFAWLVRYGLVQLTLSAQERLAVEQSRVLLRDRYLRLNHEVRPDGVSLALDSVTDASTAALRSAALATVDTFSGSNRAAIRRFLSHQSQGPRRPPLG